MCLESENEGWAVKHCNFHKPWKSLWFKVYNEIHLENTCNFEGKNDINT